MTLFSLPRIAKRLCALLATVAAVWVPLCGAPVDAARARAIAASRLGGAVEPCTTVAVAQRAPGAAMPYYVFNAATGRGYAIVAGDDRAPAVLAYSPGGTINAADVPPALQELLDDYAEQMAALDAGARPARLLAQPAIAPMVTSHWGQGSPFNHLLPYYQGKRSVTGCVATAMAQVMYYHQWPARPTQAIPAYTSNGTDMPELAVKNFNWTAMTDVYYQGDTTTTAGAAVATLMLYCGQAVGMSYNSTASSASTNKVPYALSTYFGYKASSQYVRRANYTNEGWEQLLHSELAAGRPVVYAGNKKSGGHAFVCDGCDGEGRFHINWGWNSQSDGYFVLSVLNPGAEGIGSANGSYGYVYRQGMAIGLEPGTEASTPVMTSTDVKLNTTSTTLTRSYSTSKFYLSVYTGCFYNMTSQPASFSYGWGFYDSSGKLLDKIYTLNTTDLKPNYYAGSTTATRTLSFGANKTSGTYYLKPICTVYLKDNWVPCLGADMNYVKVVINSDTKCTITGYGTMATPEYAVDDVAFQGTLRAGKPVNVALTLTNNGNSTNDLVYMYVDGTFMATALSTLGMGETGTLPYRFTPTEAGTKTLTFSLNSDGSAPIATRTLAIAAMPEASLTVTAQVLDVIDQENRIVGSDRFSVLATIENTGTTDYDEDFSMRLYRVTNQETVTGTVVRTQTVPLQLAAGATTTLRFDFDDLLDGVKYFGWLYYYSAGELTAGCGTKAYTFSWREPAAGYRPGDVNGDGTVDVEDVNCLINIIVAGHDPEQYGGRAEVDGAPGIDVGDVNAAINLVVAQ